VRGDELGRHHRLDFVFRRDPNERRHDRTALPVACSLVGMLEPKRPKSLVAENIIPMV
jgi:hypothetical protein